MSPYPDGVRIRKGEQRDLPALTELYNHYVRTSPATFDTRPFRNSERRGWFAQFSGGDHVILVTESAEGSVLGYATSGPLRPKPAYDTSVETTIYLTEGATGQGIGTRLYARLFDALAGRKLHRAYAAVTLPNPASEALHERFGFHRAGVWSEAGHKLDRYWDVAWLEKRFPDLSADR